MKTTDERERILVVRFSSLGDILLTAPAIRALRNRFADAEIYLLVAAEYADAAALIPGIDRVLTFDRSTGLRGLWKLRARLSRQFTIFIDLQNTARSAFLRVFTFPVIWTRAKRFRFRRWLLIHWKWNLYRSIVPVPLRYLRAVAALGAVDDERGLELRIPEVTRASSAQLLNDVALNPVIALCPGARHFTKRWPADRWIELGRQLQNEGAAVIVFGARNEDELIREIAGALPLSFPMVGRSIPEVAALMERCAATVSNDSGLMHIAAGVGTPVVAIFGPTVEEFGFFPFRARSEVVQQNLKVRPCSAMGTEICKEVHFRCMLDTTPARVAEAVHRVQAPERDKREH